MYVAIDTETTGKHDFKLAHNADSQPFPIQIGLVAVDEERKTIHRMCLLLRADGMWNKIEAEAFEVHGISYEHCEKYGVRPISALHLIKAIFNSAKVIVAHGFDHDMRVLLRLAEKLGVGLWIPREKQFCTMKEFSKLGIKMPGQAWPKWPKLEELHQYYFATGFNGAHNALADAEAALRCYFEITANAEMKGAD